MVNFGERIKHLRTERHLTQKQVADQAGVAVSAISSYEAGSRYPSYTVLIRLAHIFHVSTDYLLGMPTPTEIDTAGLDEEQIEVIEKMIAILRKK